MRRPILVIFALLGAREAAADKVDKGPANDAGPITFAFAGDVMFGRFIEGGFQPIEAEKHPPFEGVKALLQAADLTMVNLETPVMATPPPTSSWGTRMRFVATPKRLATLVDAGVDVVSLANNHWYDMRTKGVAETPGHCQTSGLTAIGAATDEPRFRIETLHVRGKKIGAIAATTQRNGDQRDNEPLLPFATPRELHELVVPLVTKAAGDHDLVMVVMHWGVEYADAPSKWQIDAAHGFVDAGADLVIGSHPHVLQGVERYKGGVIAYSLGNFLFDNTVPVPRQTGVLTVTVDDEGCTTARFDPAFVHKLP
ncbi:MAG TPA: CapA family protein, partial [Kofleriaceae bacterium]|nr:CapA family protein [Kofleriaceae bacterium]